MDYPLQAFEIHFKTILGSDYEKALSLFQKTRFSSVRWMIADILAASIDRNCAVQTMQGIDRIVSAGTQETPLVEALTRFGSELTSSPLRSEPVFMLDLKAVEILFKDALGEDNWKRVVLILNKCSMMDARRFLLLLRFALSKDKQKIVLERLENKWESSFRFQSPEQRQWSVADYIRMLWHDIQAV